MYVVYYLCDKGKRLMTCVQCVSIGAADSAGIWHWYKWRSFRRWSKG